jgi:UTP:GlnB (protein PII) uridylyltransferase
VWCRSPKHSTPSVSISMCTDRKYWLVNIECKDRNKLLFDTVCTLADLNFEVFHATIDCVNGRAIQEYYVRSRLGFTGAALLCLPFTYTIILTYSSCCLTCWQVV